MGSTPLFVESTEGGLSMPHMTKTVRPGDWHTLESSWNTPFTAWFRQPAGARVRIRYGTSFLGKDGSKATLDGTKVKELGASGMGSLFYARLQIKVDRETSVSYQIAMGSPSGIPIEI
jgi:hypothetical protein